jgi:hypothetical protein
MAYSAREGQGYNEEMDKTTAIDKQNEINYEDYHVGDVVELSEKGEHCDGCKTVLSSVTPSPFGKRVVRANS